MPSDIHSSPQIFCWPLHLSVEPLHAIETNCVSEKVAREMALNVCKAFTSDWGLAVTGYARACPESASKLFTYYAIASQGSVPVNEKFIPYPFRNIISFEDQCQRFS